MEEVTFKRNSNKGIIIGLVVAVILAIMLFIALCILLYHQAQAELCLSPQCLRIASRFTEAMDPTVEPCQDFYKYVCGRWHENHIASPNEAGGRNGWFEETARFVDKDIREFLKEPDRPDEPESVHKARRFFRSCLKMEDQSEIGSKTLMAALNRVGLDALPPLEQRPTQSWITTIAKLKRYLDLDVTFAAGVTQSPKNSSAVRLTISLPPAGLSLALTKRGKRQTPEENEKHTQLKDNLISLLSYMPSISDHRVANIDTKIEKAAEDLIFMINKFNKIDEMEDVVKAKANLVHDETTVQELQDMVDNATRSGRSKIKWRQYFTLMYEGIPDVTLDLNNTDTILVGNKPYFIELSKMLEDVEEYKIELYIWFQVINSFGRHTNTELAELINTLNGISPKPRLESCLMTTTQLMKSAVAYYLVRQPDIEQKRTKVKELLAIMQDLFISLVKDVKWMDEATKQKAIEKVLAMKIYVGFFDFLRDNEKLDELYADVTIDEGKYLENRLQLAENGMKQVLPILRKSFLPTLMEHDMTSINAFYAQSSNYIFVAAVLLQFPFYDLGLQSLNYGAIGVMLGHEMTHGLDDTGRLYDKYGNVQKWWSESADQQYLERSRCYIDKFNNYHIPSINKSVDGVLTLGENIADHGGLIEGFLAYKKYVEKHGAEPKLPGFQNFTHEQLFFMSFAHTWCSEYISDQGLLENLADEHSPDFARVNGALQNTPEFAEAWNCPADTPMNPAGAKCKMWVN